MYEKDGERYTKGFNAAERNAAVAEKHPRRLSDLEPGPELARCLALRRELGIEGDAGICPARLKTRYGTRDPEEVAA